jgi:hypothetical protein
MYRQRAENIYFQATVRGIKMPHLLLEFCAVVVVYLESSGLAATCNHAQI